jgi:hypothetical protein
MRIRDGLHFRLLNDSGEVVVKRDFGAVGSKECCGRSLVVDPGPLIKVGGLLCPRSTATGSVSIIICGTCSMNFTQF